MKTKWKVLAIALVATSLMLGSVAKADSTFVPGPQTVKFNDFEAVYRLVGGQYVQQTTANLQVTGLLPTDVIVGVFGITQVAFGGNVKGGGPAFQTAIVIQQVKSVTPNFVSPNGLTTLVQFQALNNVDGARTFVSSVGPNFTPNTYLNLSNASNALNEIQAGYLTATDPSNVIGGNAGGQGIKGNLDFASNNNGTKYYSTILAPTPNNIGVDTPGYSYATGPGTIPTTTAILAFGAGNFQVNNTGLGLPVTQHDPNVLPFILPDGTSTNATTSIWLEPKIALPDITYSGPFNFVSADPAGINFAAIPTPTAAMGGMFLFGLLGLASARRVRK